VSNSMVTSPSIRGRLPPLTNISRNASFGKRG
jgi:hypothetical protein